MRKDIILTALLTFCLTATLFMVATTRSQEYDPWADLNEDGKIDILDVVGMTSIYGTTGDPTKNVTIAGHANRMAFTISTGVDPDTVYDTSWISIDGYSKVTVCVGGDLTEYELRITTSSHSQGRAYTIYEETGPGTDYLELVKTFDVPNEQIRVFVYNLNPTSRDLTIEIYLIP